MVTQKTTHNPSLRIAQLRSDRAIAQMHFHEAAEAYNRGERYAGRAMDAQTELIDEYDRDLKELVG